MMKRLLILLVLALPLAVRGQIDPQYSMYMFDRMFINPAFAGAQGATNITFHSRTQWVGIDGHPNTVNVSANTPLDALHGGIGGFLMFDQIGPIQTFGASFAYAFRFDFAGARGDGPALQFGIKPSFFNKDIDGTNFRPNDAADPVLIDLIGTSDNTSIFDLGAGIYFDLPDDKFYAGVSADHLLEPEIDVANLGTVGNATEVPLTFNVSAGYRIGRTGAPVTLTPNVLLKMSDNTTQVDFNLNLNADPFVIGVGYRAIDISELIGIIGFNATQRLFTAYSYDFTFSDLGDVSSGSHEIIVSYSFPSFQSFPIPTLDTMDKPVIR